MIKSLDNTPRSQLYLRATAEFTSALSQLMDQESILHTAAHLLVQRLGYYEVAICLVEDDKLVFCAWTGGSLHDFKENSLPLAGKGITVAAATAAQSVLVPDVRQDPRYVTIHQSPEPLCELAVPILRAGQVLGVIDICDLETHSLTRDDQMTIEALAAHLAITLDNFKLITELKRRSQRLAAINAASSAIAANTDFDGALATIIQKIRQALDLETA